MANVVEIRITAADGSVKVFQAVSDGAQKMGTDVESAGKKGEAGIKRMGQAADEQRGKLETLKAEATAVGTALGVLGTAVIALGANSRDANLQVDAISRAYRDQAGIILDLTERVQDYTRFSNDSAREAALTFHTLTENYSISLGQLDQLMMRSADIAQIRKRSLEDVSQMLQNAIRGEAEYAEAVGVTLNDTYLAAEYAARGLGEWTKVTDEAVKAQFRFQVLMEQTAYASGAAGDAVDNAGGRFRQFLNNIDDAAEGLGDFLGPIGEIAAEMAPVAIALPILGAGLGKVTEHLGKSVIAARLGQAAMTGLGAAMSPVGMLVGGITALVTPYVVAWRQASNAAEEHEASLVSLGDTMEWLRQKGEGGLADQIKETSDAILDAQKKVEEYTGPSGIIKWWEDLFGPQGTDNIWDTQSQKFREAEADWESFVTTASLHGEEFTAAINKINLAAQNADIDAQAFATWAEDLILAARGPEELLAAIQLINATPLSDFSVHTRQVGEFGDAAEEAAASVQQLRDIFADFPSTLDDLRLDGQGALARDIADMHKRVEDAFIIDAPVNPLSPMGIGTTAGQIIQSLELTEAQVESLDGAWQRVMQGMESGMLDNAGVMEEWNRILADSTLSDGEKVASLTLLSQTLSDYIDHEKAMVEGQKEFLANGENVLQWWENYREAMNTGGAATFETQEALDAFNRAMAEQAEFAALVDWAQDINDAGRALDQALRTFQQIDSLGQRSSSAESIATTLIGAPGELGTLQEMWIRLGEDTLQGRLSYEQYIAAIENGIAIQESNLRVQDNLNVVRAKQIPLLAEQQLAYESNIDALARMGAVEQQHALMLQDSGIQAQIAAQYSLAYSASIGEIPREVATEMIVNTAKADPAMASILEQMGLIRQVMGEDGEMTWEVNFPNADATVSAINQMTEAILYMQAAAEGRTVLDLAIELYGEEEARQLLGEVEDADGQSSTATVNVETKVEGLPGYAGALGGSLKRLLGIEDESVEVQVIPVWQGSPTTGDGTGGGYGAPELTPIEWPVTPVIMEMPTVGDGSSLIDGLAQDVEITVTQVGMETVIGLAQSTREAVENIPISWTTSIMETGASGVIGQANATANAVEDIPVDWNTAIRLTGAEAAIGNAHAIANAINAIPTSRTSTINVVTAYSSTGSRMTSQMHGGVVRGFAHGGIPAELAEVGGEMLHFANGGTMPVIDHGIYAVPPMTYVSPAQANPGLRDGGSLSIYAPLIVQAPIYGVDDLNAWWTDEALPALRDEIDQYRLGHGGEMP